MWRIGLGAALAAWAFIIIPANQQGPYASGGDLLFGYAVLAGGFYLIFSQLSRMSRDKGAGDVARKTGTDDEVNGSVGRVTEQVVVSLIASALAALAKNLFS